MEQLAIKVSVSLEEHRRLYGAGSREPAKDFLLKAETDCRKALHLAESLPYSDPSRSDAISLTGSLLNEISLEYNQKYGR